MMSRESTRTLICFLFFSLFTLTVQAQTELQSPAEYLGYELGTHFTPHNKVLGYFKKVTDASPLVTYEKYGTTNEGRELGIVKISSKDNQSRIEQIRTDNLKRTGLQEGNVEGNEIPIVWLSYNVHGNEASSSEAAMKTLYELVRPDRSDTKQWLQHTVVVMDPMINPDGRDRYVHWYNETVGDHFNPNPEAREHDEPWPGGRTNHYYFDLNRDWAWLTQKESRARLAIYQQWMPEVHVDFHEQGINEPYYFAPAAEPFHNAITDWQRQFQFTIGKNHAKYFDKNNWLYFTKEVFDLFYPSYGDTYPLFNGAIGMTYEQGGGGAAGLGIIKAEGDTLTLKDRLMHHYTTGISTVEVTSNHAAKVIEEFEDYFQAARENPGGTYKSFVIKAGSSGNLNALLDLLDKQHIRYGRLGENVDLTGFSYTTNKRGKVSFKKDAIVISTNQPKSVLARVLFEPNPELADSLTYDITAWSLPYAYGLDAYAFTDLVESQHYDRAETKLNQNFPDKPYAYVADWNGLSDVQFLAELLEHNITVRAAQEPFALEGKKYQAGTLIITRNGNTNLGSKFDDIIQEAARRNHQTLQTVSTGFVDKGADFGSSNVALLKAPRVALLSGEETSSGNVGEVWHFFEKQINYPITLLDTGDLGSINFADFDVLIMPSGFYGNVLNNDRLKDIQQWIRGGGKLIVLAGANDFLAGKEGFVLKRKDSSEKDDEEKLNQDDRLQPYSERQRERAPDSNPGSVFKVSLDTTHPMAFGYGNSYYTLKRGSAAYQYLDNGWNVGVLKEGSYTSGFVGYKAKEKLEKTLDFGVQNMGRGSVVYMIDDPLFRAFWYNGKLLFGNAVFMVGN